jgi:hypothetical protein
MPAIAYTLEHPPPDNWIPLVPVLPAIGKAAVFRRGTMDIPGPGGTVQQLAAHYCARASRSISPTAW